ncbi:MAG: SPASM domain-containing protein, partial [Candidatus Aminicenantes bacterium]
TYFFNNNEVFGHDSCFMPFYWARILSNGDLIYCPGHPDIIAGNVFKDGFDSVFNSRISVQFRKHILHNRFPICNRCCGLYMTWLGRPHEQRVRRKLGIDKEVTTHFP